MMIVVAIIAILVGILVPNFVRARAQAQTSACESNLKEIATAIELFQMDNDRYPDGGTVDPSNDEFDAIPKTNARGPGGRAGFVLYVYGRQARHWECLIRNRLPRYT
jgi:type II secretory pathway pseudopilin PulG